MTKPDADMKDPPSRPRDVRAGPGDAGASDRPVHREETPQDRRDGNRATRLFLWLVGVGFITVFVLNIVALI